jgi:hypothetical protein
MLLCEMYPVYPKKEWETGVLPRAGHYRADKEWSSVQQRRDNRNKSIELLKFKESAILMEMSTRSLVVAIETESCKKLTKIWRYFQCGRIIPKAVNTNVFGPRRYPRLHPIPTSDLDLAAQCKYDACSLPLLNVERMFEFRSQDDLFG